MSINFIGAVWDSGLYDGPRLIMMLALADHADADGWCFPSYKRLAQRIRRNEKTVYRVLSELEAEGAIERKDGRIGICEPEVVAEVARRYEAQDSRKGNKAPARTLKNENKILNIENEILDNENDVLNPENEILNIETPFYIEPSINHQGGSVASVKSRQTTSPLPPASIRFEPADRTPGGNGFKLPDEPPPNRKIEPTEEDRAVAAMAVALTDVTGISAKLNWKKGFGEFTEAIVAAGYTAEQIRVHYGENKIAGKWHWYESDWRGKKGDKPRLNEIGETIAGAVADTPDKAKTKDGGQSWLEQSVKLARAYGTLPQNP